ncbi:hypothetical protein KCU81_g1815, partial [Aureobasidium melanogenum]|uniref:Autophagy-related protein n=1 Tax=Aureobasidium melanogenum (strain CBS 110374) TaxID=1043003 RepID=A0A074WNY8_AURM1
MASNDPGLAQLGAEANEPIKGAVLESVDLEEAECPVAPDQLDERYETSRWEIWSWYLYYVGANGLSLFNFGPTAFQNLLYQQAGDSEILHFMGLDRTINSIVLLSNGISFAIQVVLFLIIGAYADFGTLRSKILIVLSIVAYAIGFGWLGVHTADKWQIGTGLYIVGLIAYQATLTYWSAAFAGLARNTREIREKAQDFADGTITREEYNHADSMKRNELSNVAFYVQSCGEMIILAVIVGIMFAMHVDDSTANNNYGLSVLIAFSSGVWLLLSLPWFFMEKKRPGMQTEGSILIAGVSQLWYAVTQIWQLRQSFCYLIGYFLLGDSLNTIVTVIGTLQNAVVTYNTLELTYLLLVGIAAQALGIGAFWYIQKRYGLSTKTMFNAVAIGIILLAAWGMIGIYTQKLGYKVKIEFWFYQVFYGIFVCPWYSYSLVMISEVTPRGKEYLFFSLFSMVGKTSAFIGPLVSSAIIDASPSHNNSTPFYFLLALSLVSFLFIFFFVDLSKSQDEQAEFLRKEKEARGKAV